MVEKGCVICREWQEHYYWEHMDVNKIHFFKIMTGDFTKGIRLPENFTRKFKGQIDEAVDLKTPSGKTWRIDLDKNGDDLFLASGWRDFVKAHGLQENDLIIFTCIGDSSFDVLIFEATGCEKVSSLFAPSVCRNFNDTAGQRTEHYSISDSDDSRMPSRLAGSPHSASTSKRSSGRGPDSPNSRRCHVKHEDEAVDEEESDYDYDYANSRYYYSRFAGQLAEEEKEKILGLAPIGPDNPVFVTVLQKSHCGRRNNNLNIPSGFAAHLGERSLDIILCRPDRKEKWAVKYYYTPYNRSIRNLQFFSFVRENKLREGDICVFELMKGLKRVMMTVHIIRKKADGRLVLVA